ncbi:MAG: Fic family protein [Sphaerochaeta sp.]|nr:Fic family protein [Sphaerochaeta sp.]
MPVENKYHNAVLLWKSYRIETPASLQQHLDSFRVLFAYHSGKIENDAVTFNDTREIFHNDKVSSFTGNIRTLFEQQNQKTCYEFLVPKILEKRAISIELVKETHAILTAGTYDERRYIEKGERPGEFKKHDYVTGMLEVGSSPGEVAQDMASLVAEMAALTVSDETKPETLLKAGAYFHAKFEYIHPFADGNGRVGRTLLNYFLMINGHPPLIVYEEDRGRYFDSLRFYDRDEDLEPMFEFLRFSVEKTWEKSIARSQGDTQGKRLSLKELL